MTSFRSSKKRGSIAAQRYVSCGIALLATAVVVIGVVAFAARGPGSTGGSGSAPRSAEVVAPAAVLSRAPYMGVSCPVANSIACDRVGLAVWLKRPAVSVTATIAGAKLSLHTGGDLADNLGRPGRAFDGYLQPAGVMSRLHVRPVTGNIVSDGRGRAHVTISLSRQMWFGAGEPSPPVQLTIDYGSGGTVRTRLRVPLNAGWG